MVNAWMIDEGGAQPTEDWTARYVQAGGSRPLSGPALAAVARDVLARDRSFRFLAPGASMSPFIRSGDVLTLVPFDPESCAPGDVVAFARPGTSALVVHRVTLATGSWCRIQGDNNQEPDGGIPCDTIIGRVSRVERAGRQVRFGLGPERALIALLSRQGWLHRCMIPLRDLHSRYRRPP
jgi:signal peptidase I